jgi:ABC-type transport system involved in cytochrome c biogenesis permease subunit
MKKLCVFFLLLGGLVHAAPLDMQRFATLPVVHEGRTKPLDTFARLQLTSLSGRDTLAGQPAISWLAQALFDQEQAFVQPVFYIANPAVAATLGLPPSSARRYSFKQVFMALNQREPLINQLLQQPVAALSLSQRQVVEVQQKAVAFYSLTQSQPVLAAAEAWQQLANAWRVQDSATWQQAITAIQPAPAPRLWWEVLYNQLDPFRLSLGLYIGVFMSLLAGGLFWQRFWWRTGLLLLGAGAVFHAFGLGVRTYIMARPPVATLYESVLFVGFVVVLCALLLEIRRRDSLGLFIGSVVGATLHFIGLRYALEGDSMPMLVAVLNTNFWLATHVLTITIGYGCCLVVGLLGHIYLLQRWLNPQPKRLQGLMNHMLAMSALGLFFTLLGTLLGGIWADQSWGRFWGWDPKENGALLIALWLIWLLHGRLSGVLGPLLLAVGMLLTTVVVALAWFGVNTLGVGLHSYGFTEGILTNLALFTLLEVTFALMMVFLIWRKERSHVG